MRWIMAVAVVGALAWGCGGGGPSADAEALMQAAVDAVMEPGMVFHVRTDGGFDIWIDGEREAYRTQMGEEGDSSFHIGVGDGWTRWHFVGATNEVEKHEGVEPPIELRPWTDNPAVAQGFMPLVVQYVRREFPQDWRVVGEKKSEGRDVVVVEARSTEWVDDRTGTTTVRRVELERESHMLVATEWVVIPPEGEGEEKEGEQRVVYETELIPREELPEDFFSPEVVYDAVVTFEEWLEAVGALGVTPYWLGERLETKEGDLALSSVWDVGADEERSEGRLRYSCEAPCFTSAGDLGYAVTITLRPAGAVFEPPDVSSLGAEPESEEEVTVQGQDAILYTSGLNPQGLPPGVAEPRILPEVPLYSRLVVTLGDTAIEVRAAAKVSHDPEVDENPFNNREGMLALAQALEPAE